jgi:hypothetical protein
VKFNQVHFQDQRFQLGAHDDPFDIADALHQLTGLEFLIAQGLKVRADPVFKVDGFSHIDNPAILIFHDVTARFFWQGSQYGLDFLGHFHKQLFYQIIKYSRV